MKNTRLQRQICLSDKNKTKEKISKTLLDLQVHEYDREFERTSKIDSKIGMILSAYFVFVVFYIPNINIKIIIELIPSIQSYVLSVLIAFILLTTIISFIFISTTISTREYDRVDLMMDDGDYTIDSYYLSYVDLYKEVTNRNTIANDKKEKYYRFSIYSISILFILVIINDIVLKIWGK